MNKLLLLFIVVLLSSTNKVNVAESYERLKILETIILPNEVIETSGLEFYDKGFITHNDSYGKPFLYFFNERGEILKTVDIDKTTDLKIFNNDWEDITRSKKYLYIADTGNNFATRKNLSIIKLNIDNDYSYEYKINISYSDQESFFPSFKHKFDAEAIMLIKDKIVLFSKDRDSLNTELFFVEDIKDSVQNLKSSMNFKVGSLITGGDYNDKFGNLALVSYNTSGEQYLILFKDFNINNLSNNTFKKYLIPIETAQIESVKIIDDNKFWVTSEDEGDGNAFMLKLELETVEGNKQGL